ncbi:MAG: cytochrome P460 family protein [Dechloromonas sp.]|nr:cytochrome P460 family protein [Dechloromonas sp.]
MRVLNKLMVAVLALTASVTAVAGDVAYPNGFREWNHVKSMVLKPGHPLYDAVGGMHHIYANPKAIRGYKSGRFADGSVIVFDLFEAVDKDNAVSEGNHKAVVVMARNGKAHKANDGWGYEVFDPQSKKGSLDAKAQADCHSCHKSQQDKDFVFSAMRD